jgi:multidrug resistance protein MdtO
MVVIFAGAFVSAWVAGGSPRIAYAGFQLAFAFFLCVIQGPAPAFDMTVARDRVIGILLGDVVSYLVFTRIWPISIAQRIDPAIRALLRRLPAIVSATGAATRRSLAAEILASRGAIERDLGLVPYEPHWTRPDDRWLQQRARVAQQIVALTGPLVLSADRAPENSAAIHQRLNTLADVPDDTPAPDPIEPNRRLLAPDEAVAVQELVDAHLWQLQHAIDADGSRSYARA